ncbi:MAG: alpha/beta fold hydrolase [Pseudomonadota bacterium]
MIPYQSLAATIGSEFAGRRYRFPWLSADLQTLRNTLAPPAIDLSDWPSKEIRVRFDDSEDETFCFTHVPDTQTPATNHVALIHGLGGDASGNAIGYLAATFLKAGYHVTRINLRAAPMVYHLASGISHAGKSEDLKAILTGLDKVLGPQRWLPLGISLGGNMLARALGDGALADLDVAAAMTICAPLDMKAACDRILAPRNTIYARYLLRDLQSAVTNTGMGEQWRTEAVNARSVYEFDDRVTGPYHGFGDAETYYARASAGPFLSQIEVPTLILHAQDDPWIPHESYEPFQPTAQSSAQMLIVPKGGHVGFHYKGLETPAYCGAALKWFREAAS